MEGYVKLHRQLLDSTQFADPIRLKIWIWCLIKANHKNRAVPLKTGKGYVTVSVKRGQFIFGRNKASEELDIAGSTVVRHLEKLQAEKAVLIEANNQYSIITICKYADYQSIEEESEQPTDNQRTTNEQPTDTNNNVNNDNNVKKEKKKEFTVSQLSASQSVEVFNNVKAFFIKLYATQFNTEYYFIAKDGTKIQSLIKKVVFKMKEKIGKDDFTVDQISEATNLITKASLELEDKFIASNFNLSIIDQKFNEIYSSLKNGQTRKSTNRQKSIFSEQ